MRTQFWSADLKGRAHSENNNNGMDLREIEWEGAEWIHLAQDRDQWWVLVNTVMNIRVL
jgi:hypothetical protein